MGYQLFYNFKSIQFRMIENSLGLKEFIDSLVIFLVSMSVSKITALIFNPMARMVILLPFLQML